MCSNPGVTIRFKQKDRAFKKNEETIVELSYAEVESISYSSKLFGPKLLTLTTRNTDKLSSFPGGDVSRVILHVCKQSRKSAERIADYVEYRQSEAYLKEQDSRLAEGWDSL